MEEELKKRFGSQYRADDSGPLRAFVLTFSRYTVLAQFALGNDDTKTGSLNVALRLPVLSEVNRHCGSV